QHALQDIDGAGPTYAGERVSSRARSDNMAVTWTWASHSPGIRVLPARSYTTAPAAFIGRSLTSLMVSPSISTCHPGNSSPLRVSRMAQFAKMSGTDAGSAAWLALLLLFMVTS